MLELHAGPGEATGLKRLLVAISADVTVEFTGGARLFYPEYFELLDENTPAHIFNHSIEGEGYRMRAMLCGGRQPGLCRLRRQLCPGLRGRK